MNTNGTTIVGSALLLVALLIPSRVQADGGVVRAREVRGPFVITIFAPPEIACGLPADVTVMVQERETDEVVLDAAVDLSFTPPTGIFLGHADDCGGTAHNMASTGPGDGVSHPMSATHERATNKLLYGAPVVLHRVGNWQARVSVRRGDDRAVITCALPVAPPRRRLAGLWFYLALPPVVILLFAINQSLRGKRKEFVGDPSS